MAENEKIPYWGSVLLSAVALVTLIINIALLSTNRATQMEVNDRQNTIAQGQTLNQVNQGLVQAMAQAAIRDNDTKIRDILTEQGITLKTEPGKTGDEPSGAKTTDKSSKTKEK